MINKLFCLCAVCILLIIAGCSVPGADKYPKLYVYPEKNDFGNVKVGDSSMIRINLSTEEYNGTANSEAGANLQSITIDSIKLDDPANFSLITKYTDKSMYWGNESKFYVTFHPQAVAAFSVKITIKYTAVNKRRITLYLKGTGIN